MKRFNKFILTCALTAVSITVSAQDDCKGTDANGEYAYPTVTQNIPAFPTAMGFGNIALQPSHQKNDLTTGTPTVTECLMNGKER